MSELALVSGDYLMAATSSMESPSDRSTSNPPTINDELVTALTAGAAPFGMELTTA